LEAQEQLAARHIALRDRAGLTQEEEAKMAGVSPTTISGIESGKITRPHLKTLLKLARALGADVGELRESGKVEAPPSQDKLFNNGLDEERRGELAELESAIQYEISRAEYWEKKEYRTADDAYDLAVFAVEEFSSFFGWLFDHGPARPLWEAMERGVGLEIEDEYDALIDALIERTKRTRLLLFDNAERLAETEAQRERFAAKRREAETTLNANVGRRSA
jgi:transcriptional regulator with XRE-family HTH domain